MEPTSTIGRTIEIVLRIFGIWPGSACVPFCRLFWTLSLAIAQTFQYRYIIGHYRSVDLSELMDGLSETMAYSLLLFKLVIFWLNQRTLGKILSMVAIDWEKTVADLDTRAMTTSKVNLSRRISNSIVGFQTMSVLMYSVAVVVDGTSEARPLIIKMDLPFDSSKRPVYEFVMITQFLHMVLCACASGIINALLIALMLHIGGQIDILREWLVEIFSEGKERGRQVITMKKVIRKHQKIIVLSESIESLYTHIAMVLFLLDTVIMCSLGFILVISIGAPNVTVIIARTLLFYFIMNLEAFVFCISGEYLSSKSQSIGDAAYSSLWYEADSKDSRTVLFLVMRSQSRLTLTIGKVMDLSLERFGGIIKVSASYVSVLLAMY